MEWQLFTGLQESQNVHRNLFNCFLFIDFLLENNKTVVVVFEETVEFALNHSPTSIL